MLLNGLAYHGILKFYNRLPPIASALKKGYSKTAAMMLALGVNPHKSSINGVNALHFACINNDLIMIKALLKAGVDIHSKAYDLSPLRLIVEEGHIESFNLLINKISQECQKSSPEASALALSERLKQQTTESGSTLMHAAALSGRIYLLDYMKNHGLDVNSADKEGLTPLHHAVARNRLSAVAWLIENGADIHAQSDSGTPLHAAGTFYHGRIIQFLLATGADPQAKDKKGLTPLDQANKARDDLIWFTKHAAKIKNIKPEFSSFDYFAHQRYEEMTMLLALEISDKKEREDLAHLLSLAYKKINSNAAMLLPQAQGLSYSLVFSKQIRTFTCKRTPAYAPSL
jgi:ankyrin repeat protein